MSLHTRTPSEVGPGISGHKPSKGLLAPNRKSKRGASFPYLLVLPALVLFVLVIGYPFVQSLAFAFSDRSLLSTEEKFVGLENIAAFISAPSFGPILWQTIIFVGASTLGAFVIALALALALNTRMAAVGALRTGFLIPWILPGVVVSFVWLWIFDTNYGVLNAGIKMLGLGEGNTNWLDSPQLAMSAIIVAKIWHSFPWMTILILAALQGVPSEVHDAAAVDGASAWKKQIFVILPQIKPALALTLLLETIWGLQQFEIPYVMTSGGPVGSTTTFSIALYKAAFSDFDLGKAGAIGAIWTILMSLLVAIYVAYTIKQEKD